MTVNAMQVVAGGYDVGKLDDRLNKFIDELKLDLLPIDTHRGFNEETLLSIAISVMLMIVLRPDKQEIGQVDRDDIVQKIKQGYRCDVIGVSTLRRGNGQAGKQPESALPVVIQRIRFRRNYR